ncbi:MAG TPA: hypothetical protein VFR41_06595 [Acidimicrobiia bacterium]|nr:hypothetical protein [Acidimicrobiia bacterium]
MGERNRTAIIVVVVIGVVLVALGLLYLFTPAASLPSWFPGHVATRTLRNGHVIHPNAHKSRGLALLGVGVLAFVGAWWYAYKYDPADAPPRH